MQFVGVDIGNSGFRVARFCCNKRSFQKPIRIDWRLGREETSGELFEPDEPGWLRQLEAIIRDNDFGEADCPWYVSSVQRAATELLVEFVENRGGQVTLIDHHLLPFQVDVDLPDGVGVDRLLAAYAASTITSQRPLIVIQAGSAVTVDLLTNNDVDEFSGGAILPGMPMMLRLLGQAGDLLPNIAAQELADLPQLPGRNTQAAMKAGAASALIGGVQHLVGRYRDEHGENTQVILSGGDGPLVEPHLLPPLRVESHLVMQGILELVCQIADQQQ